jgi:hypothetical protein
MKIFSTLGAFAAGAGAACGHLSSEIHRAADTTKRRSRPATDTA